MRHSKASSGSVWVAFGLIFVVAGVVVDGPALAIAGVLGLLAGLYARSTSA